MLKTDLVDCDSWFTFYGCELVAAAFVITVTAYYDPFYVGCPVPAMCARSLEKLSLDKFEGNFSSHSWLP